MPPRSSYGSRRLFCSIHSLTFLGFSGSFGPNQESNQDFDSFLFCAVRPGYLGWAYGIVVRFFGGDFLNEKASSILPKKFLVPEAILSHVDGGFFAVLETGFFELDSLLPPEANGFHGDQPWQTAGRVPASMSSIAATEMSFAIFAFMIRTPS